MSTLAQTLQRTLLKSVFQAYSVKKAGQILSYKSVVKINLYIKK